MYLKRVLDKRAAGYSIKKENSLLRYANSIKMRYNEKTSF